MHHTITPLYAWAAENLRPDSPFRTALTQRSDLGAAVRNEDHQLLRHSLKHRIHPQPVEHQYAPNKTLLHLAADKLKTYQPKGNSNNAEVKAWAKSVGRLLMRADISLDQYKDGYPFAFLKERGSVASWEWDVADQIAQKINQRMMKENHIVPPNFSWQPPRRNGQTPPEAVTELVRRTYVWGVDNDPDREQLRTRYLDMYTQLYQFDSVRVLIDLTQQLVRHKRAGAVVFCTQGKGNNPNAFNVNQLNVGYWYERQGETVGFYDPNANLSVPRDRLFIAGRRQTDNEGGEALSEERMIGGTFTHEMCHMVMNLMYGRNDCNPFKDKEDNRFKPIIKEVKKLSAAPATHSLIRAVFDKECYRKENRACELIVRVPQIIAMHARDAQDMARVRDKFFPAGADGQGALRKLWNYYHDVVLPECRQELQRLQEIQPIVREGGGNNAASIDWQLLGGIIKRRQQPAESAASVSKDESARPTLQRQFSFRQMLATIEKSGIYK